MRKQREKNVKTIEKNKIHKKKNPQEILYITAKKQSSKISSPPLCQRFHH